MKNLHLQKCLCLMVICIPLLFITGLALTVFGPKVDRKYASVREMAKSVSDGKAEAAVQKDIPAKECYLPGKPRVPVFSPDKPSFSVVEDPVLPKTSKTSARISKRNQMDNGKLKVAVRKKSGKKRNLEQEEMDIADAFKHGKEAYPRVMKRYGKLIEDTSRAKGIDPDLEVSKVCIESGGDPNNRSLEGALGLDQLMPRTGRELLAKRGIVPKNGKELDSLLRVPEISIALGTDHFVRSMGVFHCPVKSLVGYEIGDGGVPSRIRDYVKAEDVPYYQKVFLMYRWIKEQKGELPDLAMIPPTSCQQQDSIPTEPATIEEATIVNGYGSDYDK
jgi:hypothetical protein